MGFFLVLGDKTLMIVQAEEIAFFEVGQKYHMEGSVSGHQFTIEGIGTGNPYE